MGWRKVDDQLDVHAKVLELAELGPIRFSAAMALWTLAGCPASRDATGTVSVAYLRRVPVTKPLRAIEDLASVGLVFRVNDRTFRFHDWHDYNPTAEERDAKKQANTERQRRWREVRRRERNASTVDDVDEGARRPVDTPPYPTRTRPVPDPSHPSPDGDGLRAPLARVPAAPLAEVAEEAPEPKRRRTGKTKREAKGRGSWEAYSAAYLGRYGVEPVRNATVNAQLGQLVARVGVEEAPEVARYYVWHNDPYYVKRGHPVGLMVKDAEKIRMEWATGRRITTSDAREAERRDNFAAQSRRLEDLEKAMDEGEGGLFG